MASKNAYFRTIKEIKINRVTPIEDRIMKFDN